MAIVGTRVTIDHKMRPYGEEIGVVSKLYTHRTGELLYMIVFPTVIRDGKPVSGLFSAREFTIVEE